MSRRGAAFVWLLFLLTHGVAAAMTLVELSHHGGIAVQAPWGGYADAIRHGQRPYRDFDVLYPPGLLLLAWVGSALPASAFHSAIVVLMLASEAAALAMLQRVPHDGWFHPALAYVLIGVLAPLQFLQLYGRGAFYDALPATLLLAALWMLRGPGSKREGGAMALLAAAILLKTYPIVAAPFVLSHLAKRHQSWRAVIRPTGLLAAFVTVPIAGLCTLDARGVIDSFRYFGRRAIEWESTPGLLVWVGGGRDVWLWRDADAFERGLPTFGWGFFAIRGPLDHLAPALTNSVLLVGMVGAIGLALRKPLSWSAMVHASLGAVVLLMVASRVFSPLYIAWLFPLVALQQADRGRTATWSFLLLGAACALTTILTWWVLGPTPAGYALVGVRTLVMLAVVGLIGRALYRECSSTTNTPN